MLLDASEIAPGMRVKLEVRGEGISAHAARKPDCACSYKSGDSESGSNQDRIWWMDGYWAADVVKNCRGVTLPEMLA